MPRPIRDAGAIGVTHEAGGVRVEILDSNVLVAVRLFLIFLLAALAYAIVQFLKA